MNTNTFLKTAQKWMMQSTSILGSSGLLAIWVAVLAKQMTWQQAIAPSVGAILAVAMPQLSAPTREEVANAASTLVVQKLNDSIAPVSSTVKPTVIIKP